MYRLSNEELQAICRKWQETLSLQHWCIKIKYARRSEMTTLGYAEVFCKTGVMVAVIIIGIFANRINKSFNSVDTSFLRRLKE